MSLSVFLDEFFYLNFLYLFFSPTIHPNRILPSLPSNSIPHFPSSPDPLLHCFSSEKTKVSRTRCIESPQSMVPNMELGSSAYLIK